MKRTHLVLVLVIALACDKSGEGSNSTDESSTSDETSPVTTTSGAAGKKSLKGTRWRYETIGKSDSYKVDFLEGGHLHRHKHGKDSDSWKQSGESVAIVINDGVKLDGRIINGHTILGHGVNPGKAEWTFRMVRLPAPGELAPASAKLPLVGSKWKLDAIGGGSDTTVWILPERWHTKKDNNPAPDVWKKDGNKVTVSVNGGIAKYELTLIGTHTMYGTAKGKDNSSWQVMMTRVPSPAEISCGPRPSTPLPGTVWELESVGASVTPTWEMLDDGKLYSPGSASNPEPETWKRDGDDIAVDVNGGFVEYRGKLLGDHTIVGWALNKKGKKWWFRALRRPSPAEGVCGG